LAVVDNRRPPAPKQGVTEPSAATPSLMSLPPRAKLTILGAILLTLFLAALDQTVVGTALPRIVTDLNGASLYAWVVSAYLLSSTVTVPIYGKFSDVFGRKRMLMIGVCIFLIGSWLSGASQNMSELVAFRAIQGLGAGALFPIVMATIGDLYSPRERGRFQGLFGAVFALSFLVGPFIGGWITDNVSWHWVFYVNLPFGIAALVVLAIVLPSAGRRQASLRDLDYLGIVFFTAGVVPFMLGLTNKGLVTSSGQLASWTDLNVGGLIALGLVILLVFLFVESKATEPIIPLDLFRDRDYAVSMAAVFAFGIAMFAAVIFMPRFYQTVRGISATASGYYIWPLLVGLMGGSIGTGLLISRLGRYKWLMTGGAAVMLVGGFLMTQLTAGVSDWVLWSWMLLLGLGIGPAMAGYTVVVQNLVPTNRLGVATSTLTFLRQIGASVGLAAAGTIFSSSFANRLPTNLAEQGVPQPLIAQLVTLSGALQNVGNGRALLQHVLPGPLEALIPSVIAGANNALALSIGDLFWITMVAGVLGLACTLILRDRPLRTTAEMLPSAAAVGADGQVAVIPVVAQAGEHGRRPAVPVPADGVLAYQGVQPLVPTSQVANGSFPLVDLSKALGAKPVPRPLESIPLPPSSDPLPALAAELVRVEFLVNRLESGVLEFSDNGRRGLLCVADREVRCAWLSEEGREVFGEEAQRELLESRAGTIEARILTAEQAEAMSWLWSLPELCRSMPLDWIQAGKALDQLRSMPGRLAVWLQIPEEPAVALFSDGRVVMAYSSRRPALGPHDFEALMQRPGTLSIRWSKLSPSASLQLATAPAMDAES
jgi:EmrB/QacA subfamily drug resistance transporter